MIWATILQKRKGNPTIERGDFGFQQIPSPGDHFQIINDRGLVDLLQVEYIQHTPSVQEPNKSILRPITHVLCELVGEDVPLPPQSLLVSS
jgi:hypothetical protein